ncbi:hypothetical protein V8E36_007749 [Tilletia maclaganii]
MIAPTLSSLALAFTSALALTSTASAAPARRDGQDTISCHAPLVTGSLLSIDPFGFPHVAALGTIGTQQELVTSIGSKPANQSDKFQFTPCDSKTMPSGVTKNKDGSETYYGLLRPDDQPSQCIIAFSPNLPGTPSSPGSRFGIKDCATRDDFNYITLNQWFSVTVFTDPLFGWKKYSLDWVGKDRNGTFAAGPTNTLIYTDLVTAYEKLDDSHFVLIAASDKPFKSGYKYEIRP